MTVASALDHGALGTCLWHFCLWKGDGQDAALSLSESQPENPCAMLA